MFLKICKYLLQQIPLCITSIIGFVSAAGEQTKFEIESLFPQNMVEKLLETYSEKEKNLIFNDLKNINNLCFQDKEPSIETERIYVATAGGPGACKSTILENYIQNKPNFVYVDPDPRALKFMINTYYQSITYHQISKNRSYQDLLKNSYNKWRWASNYIAYTILNNAYNKGYSIAHGTTSTSPTINLLYKKLKQEKYKIILLLCYTSDDARIKALEHRAHVQAFVQSSAEDTINKGKIFVEKFPTYFEYADEINLYWTQNFLQGSIHAATYKKETGLIIHDKEALNFFTKQYNLDNKNQMASFDKLTLN